MTRGMKFLIVGLGISLTFNFLTIGFIAGSKRAEHHMRVEQPANHLGTRTLRGLASVAPEAKRAEMRKKFRELRQESRKNFRKMSEQHRKISTLLSADEIDEAALKQAFEDLRTTSRELQNRAETLIIDVAKDIPVEDRRRIIERMGDHRKSHHRQ